MNETSFFINLEKGWQRPERFDMNLQIYTSHPCKPLSSFRFLESCISWTTWIFSGLRWILLDVTTNSKNFPLDAPRKNLIGFIFIVELVWCRTLSSSLRGDRLCHDFSRRYHRHSILRSCIYAHGRSRSWRVDISHWCSSSKRHYYIAVYSQRHPERCVLFIFREHFYLILPWEAIHERRPLKTACVLNHNIHDQKRKFIFRAGDI